MKVEVHSLCVGQPRPFNGAELSAIGKLPVDGPANIRSFGIEGDMVADTRAHGGPDMAVHLYPRDHYGWWREQLGPHALLDSANAFGENIVASGIDETIVAIGDRFRLGTALLEISQPRQPCWKIEHHFGTKGMVAKILTSHRCGWYFRVLEEGIWQPGDILEQVETGHSEWPIARLFAKLYDKAHKANPQELREIAALDRLCELWRSKVRTAMQP